jgi:hypothetical protein
MVILQHVHVCYYDDDVDDDDDVEGVLAAPHIRAQEERRQH